jgi:hypothetical protein
MSKDFNDRKMEDRKERKLFCGPDLFGIFLGAIVVGLRPDGIRTSLA